MKKVFSILMVAFAMTAMVACGDDNKGGSNNGGGNNGGNEQTDRLAGKKYHYKYDRNGGFDEHTVTFGTDGTVEYHVVWNRPDVEEDEGYEPTGDMTFRGTYTYSEEVQGDVWEAEGLMKMGNGDLYLQSQYRADEFLLKLYNAMPSGESVNLDKVK